MHHNSVPLNITIVDCQPIVVGPFTSFIPFYLRVYYICNSTYSHLSIITLTDARERKTSTKKKNRDPNRPLSPTQEAVDESLAVELKGPRSADYDSGMSKSKFHSGMSQGRGQQGKSNQMSEYSEGEMKIDGPWQDDEGTVNVLCLLDGFVQFYHV